MKWTLDNLDIEEHTFEFGSQILLGLLISHNKEAKIHIALNSKLYIDLMTKWTCFSRIQNVNFVLSCAN